MMLKLMIHVGRDDKIILILHKLPKILADAPRRINVPIVVNMSCPPGSPGLIVRERIKATGTHIPDPILPDEIEEVFLTSLSAVGKPGRC